jgi:hypothetical protein
MMSFIICGCVADKIKRDDIGGLHNTHEVNYTINAYKI